MYHLAGLCGKNQISVSVSIIADTAVPIKTPPSMSAPPINPTTTGKTTAMMPGSIMDFIVHRKCLGNTRKQQLNSYSKVLVVILVVLMLKL